jgi:signal transduction histidine kinase
MPSFSRAEFSGENESQPSRRWAFLCDNDGRVIRDFGELTPCSSEPTSAHSLVGALTDFLETVGTDGAVGWTVRTQYWKSASSLLLQGCQTPWGILIFATLALGSAALSQDRSTASATVEWSLTRNDLSILSQMLTFVHDVRNPISSIISACDYLQEYSRENLDPAQLEMIAGIESAAKTLLQLSNRISHLSDARKNEISPESDVGHAST